MIAVLAVAYAGFAVLAFFILQWAFMPFWEDRPERYIGMRRGPERGRHAMKGDVIWVRRTTNGETRRAWSGHWLGWE